MNSHIVEISIVGGVEEIVRGPNPGLFVFLFCLSCVHLFLGTRSFV